MAIFITCFPIHWQAVFTGLLATTCLPTASCLSDDEAIESSLWYDSTVKTKVILYSRPGCHLCEEAKEAIRAAGCTEYTLDEVNIESDPELLQRYKDDIPVITFNGVEAFRHRVTAEEFRRRILASPSSP